MTAFNTFVPASMEDFKRAAKDLSRSYPALTLQNAQELLARMYGHSDLHALQARVAAGAPPGPYLNFIEGGEDRLKAHVRLLKRFTDLAEEFGVFGGRRGDDLDPAWVANVELDDLALLETPESRRDAMELLNQLNEEIRSTSTTPAMDRSPSDYLRFFVRESGEGIFCRTGLGGVINKALLFHGTRLMDLEDSGGDTRDTLKSIWSLCERHPNNPGLISQVLDTVFLEQDEFFDGVNEIKPMLDRIRHAREGLRELIGENKGFIVENDLVGIGVGHGLENSSYFSTLCWFARLSLEINDHDAALEALEEASMTAMRNDYQVAELKSRVKSAMSQAAKGDRQ